MPSAASTGRTRRPTPVTAQKLNFAHEGLFGWDIPIDGNLGLRAVHTDESATAGKMFLPTFTLPVCDPVKSGDNCAAFNAAKQFSNNGAGGAFDLPGVSQSYTDYLPSFNIRFGLSDELQSRVALSQSMVRPDFAYTVNQATLTYTFCGDPKLHGRVANSLCRGNAGNQASEAAQIHQLRLDPGVVFRACVLDHLMRSTRI